MVGERETLGALHAIPSHANIPYSSPFCNKALKARHFGLLGRFQGTRASRPIAKWCAGGTVYRGAFELNATTFTAFASGTSFQKRSASSGKTTSRYVEYNICGLVCPNSEATRGAS